MKLTTIMSFLVAVALLGATTASAAVVASHVGSADPVTEGWSLCTAGTCVAGAADAGPPANWRITGHTTYTFNDTTAVGNALTDPTGWHVRLTSKLTRGAEGSVAMLRARDAGNRFEMHLLDGTGSLAAGLYYLDNSGGTYQKVGTVDPTDGFHTYVMELNPVGGVGAASNEINFYVDGALVDTITRSNFQGAGGAPFFFFGRGTLATIDVQHALVSLASGPIPEPSALAVLGVGLVGLIGRRRRA